MARFGLLMLNNGDWDGRIIMEDKSYFNNMINSSQGLNRAYGYLWWLNGKSSFKLRIDDNTYQGKLSSFYPDDTYFALGAQSQILVVIPSQNVIIVRMGNEDVDSLVPLSILDEIGKHFEKISCNSTSLPHEVESADISIYPNPISEYGFKILSDEEIDFCKIIDINGQVVFKSSVQPHQYINPDLTPSQYFIQLYQKQVLVKTEKAMFLSH